MAQSLTQKVVNTFIKGLVTEAAEMTFPPDASVDELNCALFRDGTRRRREGIKFEDNNVLSSFTFTGDQIVSTGDWKNVGGTAEKEYLIVQVGSILHFYHKLSEPFSSHEITGQSLNLTAHEFAGALSSADFRCQFASLNGVLIVSSPAINTIYVEETSSGNIIATEIDFRVRDFEWQSDRQLLSDPIPNGSVTNQRKYDTANSGWVGTKGAAALSSYTSSEGEYPALNLPWYAGKNADGDFKVSEWKLVYSGTTLTSNGHYILNFFDKNRGSVSGISGVGRETENSRFKTVESFAGRIFYAGLDSQKNSGVILFSRLLEQVTSGVSYDNSGLGDCFQSNDPTAEDISDLLDTDGGVIRIPDAIGIQKLHSYQNSLFVMAENGIWRIKGIDDSFRATEYSVTKISEVGIRNTSSFVSADGIPFWWSDFGIYTLSPDSAGFNFTDNNLTISSIQGFYEDISSAAKEKVTGVFDRINKRILVLDVVTGNGNDVVTGAGDDVVSTQTLSITTGDPRIVALVRDGATGRLTFATFTSEEFLDWGDTNYRSFAEAGYDFMGDSMSDKTSPYIQVFMRTTETGWTGDETNGYNPLRPSSMLVSAYWDFKKTSSSGAQQAYRFKTMPVVNPSDLSSFNYPNSVIDTRLKVRGKGKSMRLRFESEEGKDFILIGYGIIHAKNQRF